MGRKATDENSHPSPLEQDPGVEVGLDNDPYEPYEVPGSDYSTGSQFGLPRLLWRGAQAHGREGGSVLMMSTGVGPRARAVRSNAEKKVERMSGQPVEQGGESAEGQSMQREAPAQRCARLGRAGPPLRAPASQP